MSGSVAVLPKVQFTSATGVPLVNGTVTVYLAGTVTPTNTWQDADLSVLNTNPIQLDARGECLLWTDPSLAYKFVLKNAAGVEQWTVDDVTGPEAVVRATLAASGGSALVGFLQAGTGAVARTVQSKLRETVSVLDFGAVADCTTFGAGTDNLTAFNACITYANANGYDVFIPPGRYRLSSGISVSNTAQAGAQYQDFRCSFIGSGPRQSQLWFDNGSFDGLTINGTLTNTGNPSWQTVSGLSLLKNDRLGNGLVLNGHFHAQAENCLCMGWQTGHYAQDVHEMIYTNFVCLWNNYGAKWLKDTFTQPNIISLYNCTFGNNANYGFDVINPTTFTMVGGSVESNGDGGADSDKWGARIIINATATEGTAAALFNGVYFENNVGLTGGVTGSADLHISNSMQHAGVTVVGCSFQRHANYALNCIRYDSSGGFKNRLTLLGNGFRGFADYTASAGRPYVVIATPSDTVQVVDLGNIYADALEVPDFSYPYVTPQAVSSAWCRFDGTVGGPSITPTQSHNVSSITKNGTGDYTITYKRALSTASNCYDCSLVGANGVLQVFAETTTTVRVRTVNLSGVATDFVLSVGVKGGMNYA